MIEKDQKRFKVLKQVFKNFFSNYLQDLNFALYSLERDNHMTSVLAVPKHHF